MPNVLDMKKDPFKGNPSYNVVAGSFYDSIKYHAGQIIPNHIEMFHEPVSSVRAIVDTNMMMVRKLPPPMHMRIDRLTVSIPRMLAEEDVMNLLTNYLIELSIGDRMYIREPLISLPMQKGQLNISPIRKCKSCLSCYVDLKCPHCGSPEFELFGEHDPTNPEYASNVLRFVFDCSGMPLMLDWQWCFTVRLVGTSYVLQDYTSKGRGLMVWVNLEGLVARGIS